MGMRNTRLRLDVLRVVLQILVLVACISSVTYYVANREYVSEGTIVDKRIIWETVTDKITGRTKSVDKYVWEMRWEKKGSVFVKNVVEVDEETFHKFDAGDRVRATTKRGQVVEATRAG